MEQKKKNTLFSAIIYLVIFIAYNLIVFTIISSHNTVFWVSYVFMMTALLIHILCVFVIFKNISLNAVFFGIPLMSFSIYFVCAEIFSSIVFMIFQKQANLKIAILIQALLLCVFIIIALISIMTRDTVQHVDNKIRENISFVKGLNVDVEMLIQRSQHADTTASLKKLSEIIKYSDPMSNRSVSVQEQMIMQHMTDLRMAFDSEDMQNVKALCGKLELLFIERNKKIMISK